MMRNGIPFGRVFGTELRVHVSWVLIVVLLVAVLGVGQIPDRYPLWPPAVGWIAAVITAAGFFLSVVVHEIAHIAVARRARAAPAAVLLLPFGAIAPVEAAAARPGSELAIAAAGPIASLVLGLGGSVLVEVVAGALPDAPGVGATAILEAAFLASLLAGLVGFVNLLPVYPLDGARMVRAIAWGVTGDAARAGRVAARFGRLTGYGIMFAGVLVALEGALPDGLIMVALGWVMRGSSIAIGRREQLDVLIEGITVGEVMDRDLPVIPPQVTLDTFADLIAGAGMITAIPVMAGDTLLGVVGLRDIRRIQRRRWETTRATEIMAGAERLPVLRPEDDLRPAVARLAQSGVDGLPVLAEGRLVGLLTRFGVGRALQERMTAARTAAAAAATATRPGPLGWLQGLPPAGAARGPRAGGSPDGGQADTPGGPAHNASSGPSDDSAGDAPDGVTPDHPGGTGADAPDDPPGRTEGQP